MSEVEIKSHKIELVDIDKIVVNPRNNNRHNPDQVDLLVDIINDQGFRNPLTVSTRDGTLVSGELRYLAAQKAGLKQVPVMFQHFESEAEEYAHLTADNELAKQSQLDLQQVYMDVDDLEMNPEQVRLMAVPKLESLEPEDLSDKNKEIDTDNFGNDLEHACPKCGFEFND